MIELLVAAALLEPNGPSVSKEQVQREEFITRERIPIPYMLHASLTPYVECLANEQQSQGMVPQAKWHESSERSRAACAKKRSLAKAQAIKEAAVKLTLRPDARADYVENALVGIENVMLNPPSPPSSSQPVGSQQ